MLCKLREAHAAAQTQRAQLIRDSVRAKRFLNHICVSGVPVGFLTVKVWFSFTFH